MKALGTFQLPARREGESQEQLAARVEMANLDSVKKDAHMALADVMEGWKGEGKTGDNCPKVVMAIPCAVPDHKPTSWETDWPKPGQKL